MQEEKCCKEFLGKEIISENNSCELYFEEPNIEEFIEKQMMSESLKDYPKHIIYCDNKPIGCVSTKQIERGVYEVGNLCVIPEFQGKGIGTNAISFVKSSLKDWKKLTLLTPSDKTENVKFYTEKCGFQIVSTERDGDVELYRFVLER